ncbi:helix-turn-helix domain-containing protein [Actinomadura rubrisoli]|uniref:XRE family transcriptional regulator n=1 Tax=Actinomadura rubrisoli TaxID=2530368 RepID=A0A4R4ZWW3_9ACTN|nr:helix-turn-helix domain-containing protein [Actinomadura rubrisoli]TDD63721.1 XRE family transcriptional regulator [Actinomadura rubrisoli]
MINARRRRFGAYLARLRRDARKSQRQLAEMLCQVSGTASVTRHEVSRRERGERVPDVWLSAPAKARALYLDRVAWAHTKAGNASSAMRTLSEAHEVMATEGSQEAPDWAYWVSSEELDVMDARVYTELRRPLRAVPLLKEVLSRYDPTHTRELALYLSWLAVALADANEPEEAASTAGRLLHLTADFPSDRTAKRGRFVLAKLEPYREVPEVREVLDMHTV